MWGVNTFGGGPMLGVTDNRAAIAKLANRGTPGVGGGTIGTGTGGGVFQPPQSLGGGTSPEQIIQLVNEINQRAQQTANAGRIPQGAELEQLSSGNIGTALRGELDPSVINQIAQRQAERGAQMGIASGSPSNNAAYLKALGLNSLDLMNTGQGWLSAATARNPAAPIYNAGNMVLTPEQQAQIDLNNRQLMEQIRSNREREAIARAEMNRRGYGSGGGGGYTIMPQNRTAGGGDGSLPDLFSPTIGPSTGTRGVTTTSRTAAPGQGNSLYDMGGSYFNDTLVSPGGTSFNAPNSLADTGWNDYFDNTLYGGQNEPTNYFNPVQSLYSDADWEDAMFW